MEDGKGRDADFVQKLPSPMPTPLSTLGSQDKVFFMDNRTEKCKTKERKEMQGVAGGERGTQESNKIRARFWVKRDQVYLFFG